MSSWRERIAGPRRLAAGLQLVCALLGFVILPGVHLFSHQDDHDHGEEAKGDHPEAGLALLAEHEHEHEHEHPHFHEHDDSEEHAENVVPSEPDDPSAGADDHHRHGQHGRGSLSHFGTSFRSSTTRVQIFAVWRAEFVLVDASPAQPAKRHPWAPQLARGPPTACCC